MRAESVRFEIMSIDNAVGERGSKNACKDEFKAT